MRSLYWRALAAVIGAGAAAVFASPHRARAAGQTVVVWWNQDFYQAKDQPLIIYYVFRRYMSAGLTMGGVKG